MNWSPWLGGILIVVILVIGVGVAMKSSADRRNSVHGGYGMTTYMGDVLGLLVIAGGILAVFLVFF